MIYFPTNWGAKEPQNLPNHRVVSFRGCKLQVFFTGNMLMPLLRNIEKIKFGTSRILVSRWWF